MIRRGICWIAGAWQSGSGGRHQPAEFLKLMQSAGAIRAWVGIALKFADMGRFVEFVRGFRNLTRLTVGDVTFDVDSGREWKERCE